jgi:hypothetical protein
LPTSSGLLRAGSSVPRATDQAQRSGRHEAAAEVDAGVFQLDGSHGSPLHSFLQFAPPSFAGCCAFFALRL